MNLGNYDMNSVQEFGGSTIPPGTYTAAISNAEVKNWPSGDKYLSLWFRIDGPSYAGQIVFDSLSLWDKDPQRQAMAYSRLKSIRSASGLNPNIAGDTDDLLGKRIAIKVSVKDKDGRTYQNINAYKRIEGAAASAQTPPQAAPMPGGSASAATPW
jgi:hypothetical protein